MLDLGIIIKELLPIRSVNIKLDEVRKLTLKYLMLLKHMQKKEREKQYYNLQLA